MESVVASTRVERRKQGKALRDMCPRTAQAEWKPRSKSQDIIKLLEESDADRIPGLIPVKYQRMSVSPFTFFRGTAIIQARDLANSRVSGITVQACGDCHLANFGGFASPERVLVFDINDFDETFPGPWEWDVKRLGASLILAARDRSFSKSTADEVVRAAAASYRERMSQFAEMKVLDTWYAQVTFDAIQKHFRKDADLSARLARKHKKALSQTSEAVVPKLTEVVNGLRHIADNPPVIYHFHELKLLEWAASGLGAIFRCFWPMKTIRSSFRSRKRADRFWSRRTARAAMRIRDTGWWRASESCKPQATSF
jgi:hypothetical protein